MGGCDSQVEEDPSSIYKTIRPNVNSDKTPGGVILAHSMGLGKSLTTIAFLHAYFAATQASSLSKAASHGNPSGESLSCGRALLVVPANVLLNFHAEFEMWLPGAAPASSPLTLSKVSVG